MDKTKVPYFSPAYSTPARNKGYAVFLLTTKMFWIMTLVLVGLRYFARLFVVLVCKLKSIGMLYTVFFHLVVTCYSLNISFLTCYEVIIDPMMTDYRIMMTSIFSINWTVVKVLSPVFGGTRHSFTDILKGKIPTHINKIQKILSSASPCDFFLSHSPWCDTAKEGTHGEKLNGYSVL